MPKKQITQGQWSIQVCAKPPHVLGILDAALQLEAWLLRRRLKPILVQRLCIVCKPKDFVSCIHLHLSGQNHHVLPIAMLQCPGDGDIDDGTM